jgi:uncharacterized membrane protein YfcA
MEYVLYTALIGLLVGSLVSLTGLGGGVLLLPLLILGLQIPPIVAVGSGAVFSALTKIGAAVLHWRRGNVDWELVVYMIWGSVPGALSGVGLLAFLRSRYGEGINDILSTVIGVLLVAIPLLMIVQGPLEESRKTFRERLPHWVTRYNGAMFTGFVGGALVGLTSVGSGSVIMMLLLLFYSRKPRVLVGTDIFHAVILMMVTGVAHFGLGTVDIRLVGWLLAGSVPGVFLGSRLIAFFPGRWLRRVLLGILLASGIAVLFVSSS